MTNGQKFGREFDVDVFEYQRDADAFYKQFQTELQRLSVGLLNTIIQDFDGAAFVEVSYETLNTPYNPTRQKVVINATVSHHPSQPITIVDMGFTPDITKMIKIEWKCEHCGTININTNDCAGCGAARE